MYTPDFIARTIQVWQPCYTEPLTEEQAIALIEQWSAFLNVLGNSLPNILEAQKEKEEQSSHAEH